MRRLAVGVAQFLPCRPYGWNARRQIEAGYRYIRARYGTPAAADAFQRRNNWY